jgi:hypothetical protein
VGGDFIFIVLLLHIFFPRFFDDCQFEYL